ncbi:MAG TPA: NADPH-dependent assimilatory sulfite reductase hemoprotein subunit [Pirellulales bacterium]|jgi:sulfite reductase (ferredoxin)|nr:NADPH-dependent assimilatory sulfite reductase hemoprotein subunit [Pirellulales bacterium]
MADESDKKPSPAEVIWHERRWPPAPLPDPTKKPSAVETVKIESNYLRGTIREELTDGNTSFSKGNSQLLKHHGTYQQDDREARTAREGGGKSVKSYMFMVRSAVPGGKLTSDQLLAEMDLADELGNGTLRITSRQGLQLHGILKHDLHKTIHRINEVKLSTLAACGDVKRNVMCCPAPHRNDPVHDEMQRLADHLAAHLAPRTRAYHEIWLRDPETGEDQLVGSSGAHGGGNGVGVPSLGGAVPPSDHAANGSGPSDVEPIYGPTYLPRKFKIGIGLPGDNCIDIYANDLGLLAICENFQIIGYNVLVGGGMGVVPSATKTFPAVAKRMAFVRPDQVVDVATEVIKVQRDFGSRSDRKVARLKYLIHSWGLEQFRAKVEEYYGQKLPDPHPDDVHGFDDHLGWHEQGDGRWFYGLNVENGRIQDMEDAEGHRLKSALREICGGYRPGVRLTAHQSLLFTDVLPQDRSDFEEILRRHRVKLSHEISNVRRWSMACVAWPTCGLAITEAERALPGMIDQLEVELAKLGLSSDVFTLRMTGCPNGCARPYNSDIGLVGRAADKYTVFVGGRLLGDRLNFIYKDMVPAAEVVPTLVPLFVYFKAARDNGETFGDFCRRKGAEDLRAWTDQLAIQSTPA